MARAAKGEGTAYKTEAGWRGYVTVNGKRKYFSAKTKVEAAQKKRALLQQRDTTGLATGKGYTLGAWLDHWLSITKTSHAPKTHSGYEYMVSHYLSEELKGHALAKLTVEHVEEEYARLTKRGLAGSTRAQAHSILHSALKVAYQRGHVPINYASLVVDKPVADKKQAHALSNADVAAIEAVIDGYRLEARWHLAFGLGLRPAEAIGLEWSAIDFDASTVTIRQQLQKVDKKLILTPTAKTGAGNRTIPVPGYILTMLKQWRQRQMVERISDLWEPWSPDDEPHAWVFTSSRRPGRPITDDGDSTQWRKILRSAGVPHTRRYTSRHTAASVLIGHGVDPAAVAQILGHADAGFTMRTYVHGISERVHDAVSVLDAARDKVQNKVQPEIEAYSLDQ